MRDLVRESSRKDEFEDPCDLVSRLDFRRVSSPILVFKELLKTVLGDL